MVTTVTDVNRLVAIIQRQLVPPSARAKNARGAKAGKNSGPQSAGRPLDEIIIERCQAIAVDDPQRGRKAFRVFIESVLLASFGDQLINDPKFYDMVDSVQATMETEPTLMTAITSAISHLLSEPSQK